MIFKLIPGVLLFFLSGHVVLKLIQRKYEAGLGVAPWLAVSFMLGLGAVSLQMFLYSLAAIPFNTVFIAAPWVAFGAAMLFIPAFRPKGFHREGGKAGLAGAILLIVIISQVLYSFIYSLSMPLSGWDAWFIWFVKARAFFLDRGVEASFLTNPVYVQDHPEYPLLVPLAVSWVYTAIGAVNEQAGKVIYPVQFAALLTIIYYGAWKASGSKSAGLLFAALLSLTPLVLVHAAGFPVQVDGAYAVKDATGYADITVAAYFLGAGLFIFLYAIDSNPAFGLLASLMLAMGAWAKNEGLTFALIGLILIALCAFTGKRKDIRTVALSIAVLLLFILPWSVFKSAHGLGSEYVENMGPGVFFSNLPRLSEIIPYTARYMFLKPGVVSLVWWAYMAATLLCIRTILSSRTYLLHALILGQLCAYIFVYIITPVDLKWHLGTSLDRLVLHLIPLGMLVSAVNLSLLAGLGSRERR